MSLASPTGRRSQATVGARLSVEALPQGSLPSSLYTYRRVAVPVCPICPCETYTKIFRRAQRTVERVGACLWKRPMWQKGTRSRDEDGQRADAIGIGGYQGNQ